MFVANLASSQQPVKLINRPVRGHVRGNLESYEYGPFSTFSSGDPEAERSAKEVNTTVERLYRGEAVGESVFVLQEEYGWLVGICSVCMDGSLGVTEGPYINALGRDVTYRGCRLCDGVTHAGEALLRGGLELIARRTSIDLMPEVTALVLPGNKPSIEIFERLGFDARRVARGQLLYVRPAGPAPESLISDIYMPPSRV